jgi:hypothetical protein
MYWQQHQVHPTSPQSINDLPLQHNTHLIQPNHLQLWDQFHEPLMSTTWKYVRREPPSAVDSYSSADDQGSPWSHWHRSPQPTADSRSSLSSVTHSAIEVIKRDSPRSIDICTKSTQHLHSLYLLFLCSVKHTLYTSTIYSCEISPTSTSCRLHRRASVESLYISTILQQLRQANHVVPEVHSQMLCCIDLRKQTVMPISKQVLGPVYHQINILNNYIRW